MTMDDAVCVRADVDIVDLSPPTNFVVAVDLDLYYFDIIIVVEIMSLGRVRRRRRRSSSVVSRQRRYVDISSERMLLLFI